MAAKPPCLAAAHASAQQPVAHRAQRACALPPPRPHRPAPPTHTLRPRPPHPPTGTPAMSPHWPAPRPPRRPRCARHDTSPALRPTPADTPRSHGPSRPVGPRRARCAACRARPQNLRHPPRALARLAPAPRMHAALRPHAPVLTPPLAAVFGRPRAIRANKYDLDKVPGPWKKAYPVIGNCLSLVKPDFHRCAPICGRSRPASARALPPGRRPAHAQGPNTAASRGRPFGRRASPTQRARPPPPTPSPPRPPSRPEPRPQAVPGMERRVRRDHTHQVFLDRRAAGDGPARARHHHGPRRARDRQGL
jgi:hypothetical protein